MFSQEEAEKLTRVGPGSPMGALLRRYWHPIAAEGELATEAIKSLRLFGEDLVLYRDQSGTYGLLQRRCPHRGADLSYGMVDQPGLRCSYHGWRFDHQGRCLEQPFDDLAPSDGHFRTIATISAYPVAHKAGLLWAYLGPKPAPCLPDWANFYAPGTPSIRITHLPCNWLQCQENSIDPVHFEWLHANYSRYHAGSSQRAPRHQKITFDEFEFGFIYRRILETTDDTHPAWTVGRITLWPNALFTGSFLWHVPIDDHNTLDVAWYLVKAKLTERVYTERREMRRKIDGRYRMDDVLDQDAAVMVGQGPIADRSREHLGRSDRGVILLRQRLLQELEIVAAGGDPKSVLRDEKRNKKIPLPLYDDLEPPMHAQLDRGILRRLRSRTAAIVKELKTISDSRTDRSLTPIRLSIHKLRASMRSTIQPGPDVAAMLEGHRLSSLLYLVAKLGIADHLANGPMNELELAKLTNAHASTLGRILRALAAHGIFEQRGGRFSLNTASQRLRTDARGSLHGYALLVGEEYLPAWKGLSETVLTGETAFNRVFGMSNWEHRRQHPKLNDAFNTMLTAHAAVLAVQFSHHIDLARLRTIIDVGAGSGAFVAHLLRLHSHLRGTIFDQPHVVSDPDPLVKMPDISHRCLIVGGDFFTSVPAGADLYLLKNVLHNWSDPQALDILKTCRNACHSGSRLVVLESVLDAPYGSKKEAFMLDLHMLAVTGGHERTEASYGQLLTAARFRLVRLFSVLGPMCALEAEPV